MSQSLKSEPSFNNNRETWIKSSFRERYSSQTSHVPPDANHEEIHVMTSEEAIQLGILDQRAWRNPGASGFKIRGANYLRDKKKVPSKEPKFTLDWVYLIKLDKPLKDIAKYLPALRKNDHAFTFVLQIMIPGPLHMSLVIGWVRYSHQMRFYNKINFDGNNDEDGHHIDIKSLDPFNKTLLKYFFN